MRAAKFAQICLAAAVTGAAAAFSPVPVHAQPHISSTEVYTNVPQPYPDCIEVDSDDSFHVVASLFAGYEDKGPVSFSTLEGHPGHYGESGTHWYCPPRRTVLRPALNPNGVFIGLYVIKITGSNEVTERFIDTNEITNFFRDRHDPAGFGVSIAYKFPWINSIALAPFAEFDYLHASVNHTFPNGSFLGTTANVAGTFGVKIGPQITQSLWVYGIAGVSVLNETLNINFIPVSSSRDATVAGATVGAGLAWQPSFLQGFGLPVALNFEYEHTWWQDAHFDAPAASPAFNYTFRRQDDLFKFGVTVALSPSAPVAEPPIPVKARPSK